MSDGTRRVKLVWHKGEDTSFDISQLEFRVNPVPRIDDCLCIILSENETLLLQVTGICHHISQLKKNVDAIHHIDIYVRRI